MDGVITMEDARALVGDAKLWPRVRDFLWDFAPQVHESWLGGSVVKWLGSEGSTQLPHNHLTAQPLNRLTMSSPRVKRYILESLGVEPCFHAFPKEDGSRILLLDGVTLESAAKWLGALACVESLRRVTSGEVVRELKSKLRGVYPEVFSYTAYFRENDFQRRDAYPPAEGCPQSGCPSRGETQRLEDEVVSTGYNMLFSAIAGLPASLVSRLKLKLPKSLCDLCVSAPLRLKERSSQINLSAVLKLFKLKFPEAYKLCC